VLMSRGRARRIDGWQVLFPTWIWAVPLAGYVVFLKEPVVSSRYMCALLPGLVLSVAYIVAWSRPRSVMIARVAGLLLVGYSMAVSVVAIEERNLRGASLEPERIAVGRWIAENTPQDARVYAHALGYIGFYCDRFCIGGAGLADDGVRGQGLREGSLRWEAYLERSQVDYYVSRSDPPVPASLLFTAPISSRARPLGVWRLEQAQDQNRPQR
jgi:hypothetical protein